MLRSMFAGVSGLRNHQLKMDVIGNNIANVNTYGFKASRVVFQEMYNQTLKGASSPTATSGGTNPMQVGLGVSTAAIDVLHTPGGTQTTDSPLDFAIEGEGFFVIESGTNTYYTRAGNFYLDPSGYLITASGAFVQGLGTQAAGPNGTVNFTAATPKLDGTYDDNDLGRIKIPLDAYDSFTVGENGMISAIPIGGGAPVQIGQIAISTFINPGGLTRVGDNMYQESDNSGAHINKIPNDPGTGKLKPGALEMSNVDLSKEFTDMIITQRGFQANSRVITVSDTLLEELINLKR